MLECSQNENYVQCLRCHWTGFNERGTFTAGEPLQIYSRMAHDGDMTLDATGSSFELGEIVAYETSDIAQTVLARMTEQGTTNTLTLFDVAWNDDFTFTLSGPNSGTFDLTIVCESDAVCTCTVSYVFFLSYCSSSMNDSQP